MIKDQRDTCCTTEDFFFSFLNKLILKLTMGRIEPETSRRSTFPNPKPTQVGYPRKNIAIRRDVVFGEEGEWEFRTHKKEYNIFP